MKFAGSRPGVQTLYFALWGLRALFPCLILRAFEPEARPLQLGCPGRFHRVMLPSCLNLGWNPGIDWTAFVLAAARGFVDFLPGLRFDAHFRQVAQCGQSYHVCHNFVKVP
ncbi:hypothetical protein BGZ57DRAFT_912210 [Hyaloscypha finlandica]|nr:hypothetical protein BGZ57DRAFT_912210 [Hyaloscypha finlandica]